MFTPSIQQPPSWRQRIEAASRIDWESRHLGGSRLNRHFCRFTSATGGVRPTIAINGKAIAGALAKRGAVWQCAPRVRTKGGAKLA